ncbi:TonB-dependent receptor [Mucilaginibacter sp. UR6-1]|uniref:SusC/RagA family TonB-linked outer membrane protein n=1 Tax=Mucilaginibacter sp. UR6-1 TaxID=1435643 RepID=UPI001E50D07A|nr:TonB-dependent receptor [Mucilaginibacter sp. UR6-1]MCC8407791.1 TonB-dependent receptor [Mucilaginibacter sp. UR6-1]
MQKRKIFLPALLVAIFNIVAHGEVFAAKESIIHDDVMSELLSRITEQPKMTVTGTVKDAKGDVLAGVTIQVKGQTAATSTDANGKFTISVADDAILVFSFLGYTSQEIPVAGKTVINVTMQPSNSALQEVVVVGYGTQSKAKVTGSINTVPTKLLTDRPVISLNNALQGTTPGLTVISRPGDVGSDIGGITVRGRGNLGAPEPLYVVDGVILDGAFFSRINPRDVESISVLKDAASASIYGSRAANGVILVTTKKGTGGKAVIAYNGTYGWQKAAYLPKVLGSYDYAVLKNEALTNAGRTPQYTPEVIQKITGQTDPDLYPNNNWYDLTLRSNAPLQEHEINVTGGGKTRYYASGSYLNQASLFPGKQLQRYSLRSNSQTQVNDKLTIGTNISFIRDAINNSKGSLDLSTLARMTPLFVNKQSDGNWGSVNGGSIDVTLANNNPLFILENGGRSNSYANRLTTALDASFKPVAGLSVDGNASYYTQSEVFSTFTATRPAIIDFFTKQPIAGTGVNTNNLNENWYTNSRLLTQATVSYTKTFGEHDFKVLGGSSYEYYNERAIGVSRNKFPSQNLDAINAGSTDPANTSANGSINTRTFISYFSRLNYSFRNRYLLEGNLRHDESSQFAPGHRGGTYPSASVGWRISQESFLQKAKWVNELKLRGSWGLLGNVGNVGFYDYFGGISTGRGAFLNGTFVDGAWPGRLPSPFLTWEKKEMKNIGVDATLFNRSLSIQVDAYDALTKNILLSNANSVPQEAGVTSIPSINAGSVRNKGIELTLNYSNKIGEVNYSVGGNFTRIWNKIEDLNGLKELPPSGFYINRVGEAIGSYYMYQANGLFRNAAEVAASPFQANGTGAGDIRFVDQNWDGVINDKDRVVVGNDVPYKYYGVNLSLSYKGFDLAVIGQGVLGLKTYLEGEASNAFFNGSGIRAYHQGRWTPANPDANAVYPRLLLSENNTQNTVTNSFWLYDASYFRVKALTVGYNFPEKISKRIGASNIKVYFTSNNLFTIRGDKRMKDFDPEAPSGRPSYPQLKTSSLGLNVTF